jgi:hypothetical protein
MLSVTRLRRYCGGYGCCQISKELQMAHTNKTLADDIETLFLATSTEHGFLSSSLVKEIARFGGPIDHLVPDHVARDVYQCYAQIQPSADLGPVVPPLPPSPMMTPVSQPSEMSDIQQALDKLDGNYPGQSPGSLHRAHLDR